MGRRLEGGDGGYRQQASGASAIAQWFSERVATQVAALADSPGRTNGISCPPDSSPASHCSHTDAPEGLALSRRLSGGRASEKKDTTCGDDGMKCSTAGHVTKLHLSELGVRALEPPQFSSDSPAQKKEQRNK